MSLVKASLDLWLYTCAERQRLQGTSGGFLNMARKKSGKKGKKKNELVVQEKSPQQGVLGGDSFTAYRNRPLFSSESSDNDSEFVVNDLSVHSKSKRKRKKHKGKYVGDTAVPPNIDFAGLPEEPAKGSVKHQTRSHDAGPNNCEESKTDQDGEDTNAYDMSQVEVIDVDAEHPITDPRQLQRLDLGKIIWEKYGSKLDIFAGTADFLLYIIGELEEDTSKAHSDSTGTQPKKFVDHFGPFSIVSMYYMHNMAYSQLFQALTERNIEKISKGC